MASTINLREMPSDLVQKAKVRAAEEGITLKEFVIRAIKEALDVRGNKLESNRRQNGYHG